MSSPPFRLRTFGAVGCVAFIADREVFGDLADDQRFVAAYAPALDSLHLRGARATLESLA